MIVGPPQPPHPERWDDIRDILRDLPYPPDQGTGYAWSDIFTVRHEIIRKLEPAPRSVFEFGALYGFFLVTALDAAPSIEWVGWVDDESHTPGSNSICEMNVRHARPGIESIRRFSMLPLYAYTTHRDGIPRQVAQFDLVHVDAGHTEEDCYLDLVAATRLEPRWIMVDDWFALTHMTEIQAATHGWLHEQADAGVDWELEGFNSENGLALLTRRQ